MSLRVSTDSSACKGLARSGTSMLAGKDNPADMLTKYLPGVEISEISRRLGFFVENGRTNIVDAASVGAI